MKTRNNTLEKLILSALFVALGYVATIIIQVPTVTGYVNLGDAVVILAGFILGPVYGFVAGGLGPALADLLSGYGYYVPGTFLIKGGVALIACLLLRSLDKTGDSSYVAMLFLTDVFLTAVLTEGYLFSFFCAVLGVLSVDYIFTEPYSVSSISFPP